MTQEPIKVLNSIAQSIFDKKGFNILALDVQKVSNMTDYFVIAEGTVDRHVRAIAFFIKQNLKEHGMELLRMEGDREGDWVVLDFGSIVIHLFTPEMREKFAIEELWREGRIIDLKIDVSSSLIERK